ncbi:protein MLN51 homolog [Papaver somniferum]|uniref:protein MLN51 homolog n=1 Tax=Papaver somniferum TaxID=3469 RepID=UPI000E703F8B|nr:protein MLN51 homolog [Papaver somniferum]
MVEKGDEEEQEYESDPEEAPLPLTMRRREASDDEEGEEEDSRMDRRRGGGVVGVSDGESDGQGGVDDYESEEEESEIEEEEEEEEYVAERERVTSGNDGNEVSGGVLESGGGGGGDNGDGEGEESVDKVEGEGEKKENEPFAVPTAGAFYMHDDRFRESSGGGGRHRRTLGGRKLWESKDDRKWGHDKFEELSLQEPKNDKERKRGAYRGGRGKKRGTDRGYVRTNRIRNYDDNNDQNSVPKSVKGRGPRKYEPSARNNGDAPPNQNKHSGRTYETTMSNSNSGRTSNHTHQNAQSNPAAPRKHVFASSLSSASPPFYPSGSSNQDVIVAQKRDVQAGPSEKFSVPHANSLARGKSVVDPIVKGRQYINEPVRPLVGKFSNMQLQSSGSSRVSSNQTPQYRPKVKSPEVVAQHNYQSTSSPNHGNIGSMQYAVVQQKPVNPVQPGSQASSPPKGSSTNSSEPGETESPTGSSKSKTALVSKGKGSAQGSGRGTFLYNGAQVVGAAGNMGVAHSDQKYPGTPALLPVMQFAGQHNGGLGVPAVGMALPGYVAQPQLGFGNSEMTWVPVLANAAGALGAPYCSPYLPVDGTYYAQPSGQTSSSASRDVSTNKQNIDWKPPAERPELANDEFGQRQNKSRRYSEMSFGQ